MNFKIKKGGVPVLSKKEIDIFATKVLSVYDAKLLHTPKEIPIEDIIERYLKLEIDYKDLDKDGAILGMTVFNNGYLDVYNKVAGAEEKIKVTKGTVLIDNSLVENEKLFHRYRFTCSHEASHWILHKQRYLKELDGQMSMLIDDNKFSGVKCLNRSIENAFGYSESGLKTDEDWLEWQADFMGGALLMPVLPFTNEFFRLLKLLGINKRRLFIDNQMNNISNYETVIEHLVGIFNVSRKAVHIRLAKLNLIESENNQLSFV